MSSTRSRRARFAVVAAFAVATAMFVSSSPASAIRPDPAQPSPVTVNETVRTACNNTLSPTKFAFDYIIDSTVTSPVDGGGAPEAIVPGDSFDVQFDVTANVAASFLNGAYALIGPSDVFLTLKKVTIAPLYGATGSSLIIQDNTTTNVPAVFVSSADATYTTGSTTVTSVSGGFLGASVGDNVFAESASVAPGTTIASITDDNTLELSAPATNTGAAATKLWPTVATDLAVPIGTGTGTYTATGAAGEQASFQILGNSATAQDIIDNGGPFGNGNTGSGGAESLQTYVKADIGFAGSPVSANLVCMGGTWTETVDPGPPATTTYDFPYTAPSELDGTGGFAAVDITAPLIPTAEISSVTQDSGAGVQPAQFVTNAARAGNTINFGGPYWTPSATVDSVELCDAAGTNCDATGLTSVTAAIDGTGVLAGSAVVDASATQGNRTLKVTAGAEEDFRQEVLVLGTPTLSLSASSGPENGSVNVTGTNWNPLSGASTFVSASDSGGGLLGAPVNVVIDANGGMTGTITTPAGTAFIGVGDANPAYPQPPSPLNPGSLAAAQPFSINQNQQNCGDGSPLVGCTLDQSLYLNISPGDFVWSQDTPFVVLNSTTTGNACDESNRTTCTGLQLDGTTQSVTGSINQLTVIDARGTGAGWAISATMTDLTTGAAGVNEVLPANTMTLTPSCVVVDGTAAGGTAAVTAGAAGLLDNSAALGLCSAAPTQSGGTFTVDGDLSMDVPASINAGLYQSTLTLTAV